MIGMTRGLSAIESYIFSDDAERINTRLFFGASDFEVQVRASSIWGRGTNIGKSMEKLVKNRLAPVDSSTVLVVVSDAKTLDCQLAESNLKELSSRVKRVIWLNPVPEKDWSSIKRLEGFSRYGTMLDCSTLERLAAACRSL